jgi:hypothetical protein
MFCIIIGVLILHAILLWWSAACNFVTVDEVAHIPAGLSHWRTGSYSLYSVNPPLPRMLAVLPLLFVNPNEDFRIISDIPGIRQEFIVGRNFAEDNKPCYFQLVRLSRLSGILWSIVGALLIYRWSAELYGRAAGCLGLCLWCFGPNILAHSSLVTPDIPATVSGLAATFFFWRYLKTFAWRHAIWAGTLLGIALLCKYTFLIFGLVWPVLWLIQLLLLRSQKLPMPRIRTQLLQWGIMLLLALLVINIGYEFEDTGPLLGDIPFISHALTPRS